MANYITKVLDLGDMLMEKFREKEYYRKKIVEMVKKIEKLSILNYIYTIVSDVEKEDENGIQ